MKYVANEKNAYWEKVAIQTDCETGEQCNIKIDACQGCILSLCNYSTQMQEI